MMRFMTCMNSVVHRRAERHGFEEDGLRYNDMMMSLAPAVSS